MHETQDVKVSCATFLFRQTREKQYGYLGLGSFEINLRTKMEFSQR